MGYVALLSWPLVVAVLFQRLQFKSAIIWSIVGGYLLLPSQFFVKIDPPLVPPIDKTLVPALAVAIFAIVTLKKRAQAEMIHARRGTGAGLPEIGPILSGLLPGTLAGRILVILMVVGAVMTNLTNRDGMVVGPYFIPGQDFNDLLALLADVATVVLIVMIGRKFLSDEESHRHLMRIFCIAAMGYSLLALFEVRMSPQLNIMVYGFFPHAWDQHFRNGGWRPLVFLDHGLHLGIFLSYAIVGTVAMIRVAQGRLKIAFIFAVPWLMMTLILAKTLGALLIAIALAPVVLLLNVRLQLIAATVIAAIALSYPMLRGADIIPTDEIVEFFEARDPDRAHSLGYRFDNEDLLLEKANERPLFGWGLDARSRYYDDQGRDIAISDGIWVIIMGVYGWVGYFGLFGILTIPVMLLALRKNHYGVGLATAGLCVMISANMIDLLPNASMSQVCLLMGGALLGRLEWLRESASSAPSPEPAEAGSPENPAVRPLRLRGGAEAAAPAVARIAPVEAAEPETAPNRYTRFAQTHRRRR